jgi:hypothetical protein
MRYLLILVCCGLFACGTSSADKNKDKEKVKLQLSSMYNQDTVLYVYQHASEKNNAADKQFLSAIDLYRNKKNATGSVDLFKQSILLKPQPKTYYELGNALLDSKLYEEAITAYKIAELLDYKPLYKLLYNVACAYSLSEKADSAKYYLVSAIEFGYVNMNNILKDKDLEFVRDEYDFKSEIQRALSGASDPDKLQWNLFYQEFQPVSFPLVLDKTYGEKLPNHNITYDFERYVAEMRDSKFSRDVGGEYYYVGRIRNTDTVKTLVYAVKDMVMDAEESPAYYYIASYNDKGKLLDKLLVGGQIKLDDPFRVGTIQANGDIQITYFKVIYEKDPEVAGYTENKIIENKELNKEYYTIAVDGRFISKSAQLGMR